MKKLYITFFCAIFGLILVGILSQVAEAQTVAQPTIPPHNQTYNTSISRACLFPAGGWTIVNCSNVAAAASGQLSSYSRYVLQCTDDSYVAWGGSTVVADANDGYLPEGAWLEFVTDGTVRYVSCLNVNSDADCRYIGCL